MWVLLKRLFTGSAMHAPTGGPKGRQHKGPYIEREGKMVEADEVFDAWTSGDLSKMVNALGVKTNRVDRHFLLMNIVNDAYRQRKDPKMRELCIKVSKLHIQELHHIATALKKDMGGILPRVTTFQHYATVLTESGEYDKAIDMCKKAIALGLHDGTQSGYEGRIARIQKKRAKKSR